MKKIVITAAITCLLTLVLVNVFSDTPEENHTSRVESSSSWTCSMHPKVMRKEAGSCPICGMDLIEVVKTETTSSSSWTCSMHPKVMRKEAGSCPICGMDLIEVESDTEDNASYDFQRLPNSTLYFGNAETYTVKKSYPSKTIRAAGKLHINEEKIRIQTAHVTGRVEKSFIKYEGQKIRKGQKIMQIYAPTLITLQKEWQLSKKKGNLKNVLSKIKNLKLTTKQLNGKNGYFDIYAEFSGFIKKNYLERGKHLKKGQYILEVISLETLWANFEVYPEDIDFVDMGDPIAFLVEGSSDTLRSKVSFISPWVHKKNQTYLVRASVRNTQNFEPNRYIFGTITSHKKNLKELIIPRSAVLWKGTQSIVFLQDPEKESYFAPQTIEIGGEINDRYIVKKGLFEGCIIISKGTLVVDSDLEIQHSNGMFSQ